MNSGVCSINSSNCPFQSGGANGCYYTPPATTTPTPSGGGGGSTCIGNGGTCVSGANCGTVGYVNATGSCAGGQICCKPNGGPLPFGAIGAIAWCQDPGGPAYPMANVPVAVESYSPTYTSQTQTTDANGYTLFSPLDATRGWDGWPSSTAQMGPGFDVAWASKKISTGQYYYKMTGPKFTECGNKDNFFWGQANNWYCNHGVGNDMWDGNLRIGGNLYTRGSPAYQFQYSSCTPLADAACNNLCRVNTDCPAGYVCYADPQMWNRCRKPSCTSQRDCDCSVPLTVTGTIYNDPSQTATLNGSGQCTTGSSLAMVQPGAGSQIKTTNTSGTTTAAVDSAGNYNVQAAATAIATTVTLTPGDSNYTCICPVGCSYGINPPAAGLNFFVAYSHAPWWQSIDGLLYAGAQSGTAIQSQIPASCVGPSCNPWLLRSGGQANASGIPVTGGGNINTIEGGVAPNLGKLSEDNRNDHITNLDLNGPKEDYNFFLNLYSMSTNSTVDFSGNKPGSAPSNGRAYYANSNVTINSAWNVANGESLVIFVNGNLTINQPITVANGGFLAFITKGNITIANSIGQAAANSTTGNIEGVYIANGTISIPGGRAGGDLRFNGEGTFVGWGGIGYTRSYATALNNNLYPTELFTYRPDLMTNLPDRMKRPLYLWQESN